MHVILPFRRSRRIRRPALIFETLFFLGALAAPLFAQETEPWKGSVEASMIETSGNTDTQTLLISAKGERALDHSRLSGEATAIYGEQEAVTTQKRWMLRLKYDYNFTERRYAFISETIERNTLLGIEIRYVTIAGVGYYFLRNPADTLKGEVGLGYTRENPVAPLPDIGYASARLFGEYSHSFSKATRFSQTVEYLPNLQESSDYIVNEETAFTTNLIGNLAFKISYAVIFDNLPPPGFVKTDRLFKTALLYTF